MINGRAGNQISVVRSENPIKIEVVRVEGSEGVSWSLLEQGTGWEKSENVCYLGRSGKESNT